MLLSLIWKHGGGNLKRKSTAIRCSCCISLRLFVKYFLPVPALLSPPTTSLSESEGVTNYLGNHWSLQIPKKMFIQLLYRMSHCTTFVLKLCIVENGWKLSFPGRTVPFIDHWDVLQIASPHTLPRQHAQITLPDSSLSLLALSGSNQAYIRFNFLYAGNILQWQRSSEDKWKYKFVGFNGSNTD